MSRTNVLYVGGVKMTVAAYRQIQRESRPGACPRRRQRAKWPITSVALAVHPDQVAEANERNRRHGVNVSYRPDGRPVIPDAAAYRRLRKVEGVVDKDSFF